MAKWRIAESLKTLRAQLDAAYPGRSKASDGAIGDAAHASRASDHNPWVKDSKGVGVVTAIDVTHDPEGGVDCHKLADALVRARDPRVKYLIWNRRITQKGNPAAWKPYTGANAHKHHLHISVKSDAALYDSKRPWDLSLLAPPIRALAEVDEIELTEPEPSVLGSAEEEAPAQAPALLPPPQTPEPADEPVTVQRVFQSAASKVMAGGTLLTGVTTALGGALLGVLRNPIAFAVLVVGCAALAAWLYDRSKQRQHKAQMALVSAAANPAANTVQITPAPPKAG